jgi:hypothetical protein
MIFLSQKTYALSDFFRKNPLKLILSLLLASLSSCVRPSQDAATFSQPSATGAGHQTQPVVVAPGERPYVLFGFDTRQLKQGQKIDDVLAETLSGKGNFLSKFTLSNSESLDAGMKWVGEPFKEIGKYGSGVFRSFDGMRQFRIDKNSLAGAHAPGVVHVHYETYAIGADNFTANNHVRIEEK